MELTSVIVMLKHIESWISNWFGIKAAKPIIINEFWNPFGQAELMQDETYFSCCFDSKQQTGYLNNNQQAWQNPAD